MAKKRSNPVITHTEILCLAIAQLQNQVQVYTEKARQLPEGHPNIELMEEMAAPLKSKMDAIKTLYMMETGVEYN